MTAAVMIAAPRLRLVARNVVGALEHAGTLPGPVADRLRAGLAAADPGDPLARARRLCALDLLVEHLARLTGTDWTQVSDGLLSGHDEQTRNEIRRDLLARSTAVRMWARLRAVAR